MYVYTHTVVVVVVVVVLWYIYVCTLRAGIPSTRNCCCSFFDRDAKFIGRARIIIIIIIIVMIITTEPTSKGVSEEVDENLRHFSFLCMEF